MLGAPFAARVQVGQQLVIEFDTDLVGDLVWGVHANSEVDWMEFADTEIGVASGTATADGAGLLIVTVTDGTTTDSNGVVVDVVPAGFRAAYDTVRAPAGESIFALPESWGGVEPIRWTPTHIAQGLALDAATGALRGPMPAGGAWVHFAATDAVGARTFGSVQLIAAPRKRVQFRGGRVRTDGTQEIVRVAGEGVALPVVAPDATPPLSAALVADAGWATVADGDSVVVGGTPGAGQSGWIEVNVEDADGRGYVAGTWVVVTDALPFRLLVPVRIEGNAGERYPTDTVARAFGGATPAQYAVVADGVPAGTAINSETGAITGTFPGTVGEVEARFAATDSSTPAQRVTATMLVETVSADFAITLADINVATGGNVNVAPSTTAGFDVDRWAKGGGPAWLSVAADDGRVTGTAPATPSASELALVAISTTGERAELDVPVRVALGAVGCGTLPVIAAVRGTPGFVNIVPVNVGGGFEASKKSGPDWLTVAADGRVSWGALTATDTDTKELVVTISRTGGGSAECTITPTIANPAAPTCSLAGETTLAPGESSIYALTSTANVRSYSLTTTTTGWGIADLGGGRYRVSAPATEGASAALVATVTDAFGTTSANCGQTVTVQSALGCDAPNLTLVEGATLADDDFVIVGRGGTGTRTIAVTGLPGGIVVSAAGVGSGTLTGGEGAYNYTATVTDGGGNQARCMGTITVVKPIACAATPAVTGTTGLTFRGTLPAPTNATGPVTFARATGPEFVTVLTDGTYYGTFPARAQTTTWSYRATDSLGACTGAAAAVTVNWPALACVGANATGFRNETISAQVSPTGGDGSYTLALDAASIARGFSIAGRTVTLAAKSADGAFAYTVNVTDGAGATTTCTGTITISGARLAASISGTTTYTEGGALALQATAAGGRTPYTYSVSATGGLTAAISSAGRITGTIPSGSGASTVTATVTDAAGARATATVRVSWAAAFAFNLPNASHPVGILWFLDDYVSGGQSPFQYSLPGAVLTAGEYNVYDSNNSVQWTLRPRDASRSNRPTLVAIARTSSRTSSTQRVTVRDARGRSITDSVTYTRP